MEADCLFCKFARKESKSPDIIYENDRGPRVPRHIKPEAPVHALVIPKKHIDSVSAVPSGDPIVSVLD